jgi:rod shape-determining protein MreC
METSRDDFVIAIRSAFLKKENQQRFSLLGLIFFSIIFLILGTINFKAIDYLKIGLKEIVYRSSLIVSAPENFIKKSFFKVNDHFNHYESYQKIKYELNYLKTKNLSTTIINLENIKLKKVIDDYFITDNEIFAKVLIDNKSPFLRSVVLNKGSKNNIKLGMAVLDGIHLVGKVVEINYLTSRVLLLSDINAKIPVSLEPGGMQAIMSGTGKENAILQYTKKLNLEKIPKDILVYTSGAGGLFKSGIPIGKITKEENLTNIEKIVDFNVDFSQLKYVKVLSFSKEEPSLIDPAKEEIKILNKQISEIEMDKETIKVLLEEKKIFNDSRIKIEEENSYLKNRIISLQDEISITKKVIKKYEAQKEEIKFLELKLIYGNKCKKTFYNNLYKVGTKEYRTCVLNKGPKIND